MRSNTPPPRYLFLGLLLVLHVFFFHPAESLATCKSCLGQPNSCSCVSGSIATGCAAYDWGCEFSGSWECGGGGCFLPLTMVRTSEGDRPIDMVGPGDLLLCRDISGNERYVPILRSYRALRVGYYVINGDAYVTGDHPFYVDGHWVDAADLSVGDQLLTYADNPIRIDSIEWVNRGVRVYNVDVLSPDTFYAGGFLVHNNGPIPGG